MEEDSSRLLSDQDLKFISKWTSESNLDALRAHILNLWQACKKNYHIYVCIERFMFLKPRLSFHFAYKSLIEKLKPLENTPDSKKVVDLGCCFGQDTRKLILDGIAAKDIYAIDLHDGYWNAGRELYMDTLQNNSKRLNGITTIFGDFAVPYPLPSEITDRIVDSLTGNFNAVICQMILHVLSKEQAENFMKRICSMTKPGGILIGSCVGSEEEAVSGAPTPRGDGVRYLQSIKSLNELLLRNGFNEVEIKQMPKGSEWKNKNAMPKGPENHPEVKKCRFEFVAYKAK